MCLCETNGFVKIDNPKQNYPRDLQWLSDLGKLFWSDTTTITLFSHTLEHRETGAWQYIQHRIENTSLYPPAGRPANWYSTHKPKMSCLKAQGSQDANNATAGMTRSLGRLTQKTALNKELQEIQNSTEAHFYLEKTQLIVLPGQEPTIGLLTTAIHHVTEYKGVSHQAVNALRSIAFLLNKIKENAIHETVWDSVMVQLDAFGTDLKDYITDATKWIDEHLENKIVEISEATKTLIDTVKETFNNFPSTLPGPRNNTGNGPSTPLDYRQALIRPPPHVDPRLAAKEGIRLRQFLVEGVERDSRIGRMDAPEARKMVNQAIATTGGEGIKARSTLQQNKSGLLIKMETDVGATWLMKPANTCLLCDALSPGLNIKQRKFNVFVYNASTALDPENADHLKEIADCRNQQHPKWHPRRHALGKTHEP